MYTESNGPSPFDQRLKVRYRSTRFATCGPCCEAHRAIRLKNGDRHLATRCFSVTFSGVGRTRSEPVPVFQRSAGQSPAKGWMAPSSPLSSPNFIFAPIIRPRMGSKPLAGGGRNVATTGITGTSRQHPDEGCQQGPFFHRQRFGAKSHVNISQFALSPRFQHEKSHAVSGMNTAGTPIRGACRREVISKAIALRCIGRCLARQVFCGQWPSITTLALD
jgi:hypothetical protein